MPHDILTPQPVEGAAVYLMRLVLFINRFLVLARDPEFPLIKLSVLEQSRLRRRTSGSDTLSSRSSSLAVVETGDHRGILRELGFSRYFPSQVKLYLSTRYATYVSLPLSHSSTLRCSAWLILGLTDSALCDQCARTFGATIRISRFDSWVEARPDLEDWREWN